MASKGPCPTSKIPKLSRGISSIPSSPRGSQIPRTGVKKASSQSTPLPSPRQVSQRNPAFQAAVTPKSTSSLTQGPQTMLPVQNVQRPDEQRSEAENNNSVVVPDLLSGGNGNDFQKIDDVMIDVYPAGDSASNEDIDSALMGLIMPTSQHNFSNYLHLTTVSDDSVSENRKGALKDDTNIQSTPSSEQTSMSPGKSCLVTKNPETIPKTCPASFLAKSLSNPFPNIFDAATFSQYAGNGDQVPAPVKSQILNHVDSFVDELKTVVAKKSVSFRLDCDEMDESMKDDNNEPPTKDVSMKGSSSYTLEFKEGTADVTEDLMNIPRPKSNLGQSVQIMEVNEHEPLKIVQQRREHFETVLMPEPKPSLVKLHSSPYHKNLHQDMSTVTPDHSQVDNECLKKWTEPASKDVTVEVLYKSTSGTVHPKAYHQVGHDVADSMREYDNGNLLGPPEEYESEEEVQIMQFSAESDNDLEAEEIRDEENLKNMLNQVSRNGSGSGNKKTRTIFSVDIPVPHVESGRGENGDGRGVHSPETTSKVDTTKGNELRSAPPNPFEAIFANRDCQYLGLGNINQEGHRIIEKSVNGIVDNLISTGNRNYCSNDFANPDAIKENRSDPQIRRSTFEQSAECECKAFIPKNLILQRDITRGNVFRKTVPIYNPTSTLYAFKVCCSGFSFRRFTASPNIGLVKPKQNAFVEITAENYENQEVSVNDAIEFSIFPACCNDSDPRKLEKVYRKLLNQYPDSIHTQAPSRIITWDAGNLTKNMEFLNSIEDYEEREILKESLHDSQSVQPVIDAPAIDGHLKKGQGQTITLLKSIRKQIQIANNHLADIFQEVSSFQQNQSLILFFSILILIVVAGPIMKFFEPEKEPEEIPDSMFDTVLKGLYLK